MLTQVERFLARGFVFALLAAPALVFATGCSSLNNSGDSVATHRRGHTEEPGTAPSDGDYLTYQRRAPLGR